MTAQPTATPTATRHPFGRLVLTEAKLSLREPTGLIWGVGLPVLLVNVFGNIPAFDKPVAELGGATFFDAYAPILMVFVLAMLALVNLPIALTSYRELGVLRRMSATPVSPLWLLAAQLIVSLAFALVAIGLVLGIGAGAYGMRPPRQVPGFAVALLLATLALFTLGLCVAALARTAKAATAIGNAIFFPLAFASGLWLPQQAMPTLMGTISRATPSGAAVEALQAPFDGRFPSVVPLLVLLGYSVVFALFATKRFRWE